ncbi:WD40 repeat domain-containing protein [Chamaesiphon minutus]|uniref:WD40 repeat-containing protein n=1 Tax=Chamaesiphon minutus (strain ATCC 27169 / PCC 6605) TaxID=1173020 RepID=K9UE38_CHAP6|nr:WD40 repeat domain-containing protein [Chamaesiphon minutus]AFY92469.1 WD40 repeat-containing protein [Chamaesiphon minutus PCC 6605]
MAESAFSTSSDDPNLNSQIQQHAGGDSSQVIGLLKDSNVFNNVVGNVTIEIHNYHDRKEVEIKIDDTAKSAADLLACPYRGLFHFGPEDVEYFFGRENFVEELVRATQTRNFIPLLGASGSGKSSVVLAGLVPKLQQAGHWQFTHFRPGSDPFYALAEALVPLYMSELDSTDKITQAGKLAQALKDGTPLSRIFSSIQRQHPNDRVLLIADQFEELYTLCTDEATRRDFLDLLLAGIAAPAVGRASLKENRIHFSPVLVATMRADFLGNALSYRPFADILQNTDLKLGPMNQAELMEAIAKPAEMAGHPLDLSTIDLLIEQTAGRAGALPLLQFALVQIWAGLAEGKEPAETLRAIGGVGGALAGEAQRIYVGLTPEQQGIARRVFLGLVQLGEGAKDTRRRVELERLVSHRDGLDRVKQVIDRFANPGTRLITLANDGGAETAEVTHEALFDNWQQLKDWLDGSRSDLQFQRRLDEAVMVWQNNGRPEGNLWRSPDLDLLRRYQHRAGDDLTPLQLEFFQAADRSQCEQKRFWGFIKLSTLLSLVLTTSTTILLGLQLRQAQSLQLQILGTNAANLLAFNQPVDSTINAIATNNLSQLAWLKFPTPDRAQVAFIDGILLDTVWVANPEQNQLQHDSTVISAAYSPDGQRIVSGGHDRAVRIWDAKTGKSIGKPLLGHTESVYSVAFSPDGQQIASGSWDKTVRIWDAKTGEPLSKPLPLPGDRSWINSIAYSPDSQSIVSGSYDKTIWIWDAKTGKPIGKSLLGHTESVSSVAYSPDSQSIVSGSYDKTIRIWDAKMGKLIGKPLLGHRSIVTSVTYSPDGRSIVSGSSDKTIRIWDAKTRLPIGEPMEGHELAVKSVAYSPDGQNIVSGSDDRTVRIWDAKTRLPIGQPLKGHEDVLNSVALSPDGKHIISSGDKTVRIWQGKTLEPIVKQLKGDQDLINSVAFSPNRERIVNIKSDGTVWSWDVRAGVVIGQPLLLQGNRSYLTSVAVSPDGQWIVTGSFSGVVQVWNAKTGSLIRDLWQERKSPIQSVAFSFDGQRIVSGSDDLTIRIWDAKTGLPIGKPLFLKGHRNYLTSVAFSPDGQRIITGSKDSTVRIWEIRTGA